MKKNILLIMVLFVIPASVVFAQNQIAKMQKTEGIVEIISENGTKKNASHGMLINEEDIIITKENGKCTIQYADQTLVRILPNSHVKVNEVTEDADDVNSITCFLGTIWAKIVKTGNKEKFSVMTPTSVAGVRGTDFMVSTGEDGASKVGVQDGEVEIEDDKGLKTKAVKNEQVDVDHKSNVKKSGNFQKDNFNENEWRTERKNYYSQNKGEVLNSVETRMDNSDAKYDSLQEKDNRISGERTQLITDLTKSIASKDMTKTQQYTKNLKSNYKEYRENNQEMRRVENRSSGDHNIVQRLNDDPEFSKQNSSRLQRLNERKSRNRNRYRKSRGRRKKNTREYKKHNIFQKLKGNPELLKTLQDTVEDVIKNKGKINPKEILKGKKIKNPFK